MRHEPVLDDQPYVLGGSGHRLYVDPHDARAHELVRSGGSMNAGSLRLWEVALGLRPWDVVVDVGANYGEMLVGTPLPPGVRRVCFEPHPQVLPFLRRTIAESGLDVDLREVAVGAGTGEAAFVVDTEWSGRSGLAGTHRTDADHLLAEVAVPVRTLDAELPLPVEQAVCVKVDVEGGELDVLAGARELLRDDREWVVMLEMLHMDPFEKARLAREFTLRVMDRRTGDLVVVPPVTPQAVADLVDSSWLHGQDALLTSRAAA